MYLHHIAMRIHDQELPLDSHRPLPVDALRKWPRGGSCQCPGQAVQAVRAVLAGGVGLDLERGFGDVDAGGASGVREATYPHSRRSPCPGPRTKARSTARLCDEWPVIA